MSHREGIILYSVVTFQKRSRLKRVMREIGMNAFVVVTDTLKVMGQRIGNQPHWQHCSGPAIKIACLGP